MNAIRYLIAYIVTFVVMVALDLIWLRFASHAVFRPAVGDILTDKPNLVAAGLFYVFFAAGLIFFAVWPAFSNGRVTTAFLSGALLGFLAYMAFDLTNLAILRLWSVRVSIIDISWGTFVSVVSAAAGFATASFRV
jgi:uncharacterized membrane protein